MAKRNELPALVAALLITVAILGGGGWWLYSKFAGDGGLSIGNPLGNGPERLDGSGSGNQTAQSRTAEVTGESILPIAASATKQQGLEALAAGDNASAQSSFEAALAENRNDPESLIYLNNAKIGNNDAYTIAAAIPASNDFLGPALEIMRGVAQAQLEINEAGGINGRPLKVLLISDGGTPQTAQETATALVNDKAVLGVVGHYSSDMSLSAAEAYEAGQLAMISPTSTAVSIANAGDYIFRTVPSDRLAAASLARYMLNELNQQQAVVFYTGESAYSRSVRSEFTTELLSNGGQVVAEFDVDEPGFSAGRALQSAKQAGAKVIMLALTDETNDASLQVLSVNRQALPVIGGDSLYDFNILDVGRQDAVGLTVAVPWHILSHQQSPFVQTSQKLWGAAVNWRTVTAYDAVMALGSAIATGGDSRKEVAGALSNPGFDIEGATSAVRFFPTGDRNQPSQLVTVIQKSGGSLSGTGYDYEPTQ